MQRCLLNLLGGLTVAALPGCNTSPAAPSPLPPPPPSAFAKIVGDYALTIEVDETCSGFPQASRVRAYEATVVDKGWHFAILRISGRGFIESFEIGEVWTHGDSQFRLEWNNFSGDDFPEPLTEPGALLLNGRGTVTLSDSTLSGAIRGGAYIKGSVPAIGCIGSHSVTFVR